MYGLMSMLPSELCLLEDFPGFDSAQEALNSTPYPSDSLAHTRCIGLSNQPT
jgi:hypothetical protein